jgi:hypothetical protein
VSEFTLRVALNDHRQPQLSLKLFQVRQNLWKHTLPLIFCNFAVFSSAVICFLRTCG